MSARGTWGDPARIPALTLLPALLLVLLLPAAAAAQSIDVRDGANAVGVGFAAEFSSVEQFTLSGYSAFSISGIMDIGGYLGRVTETVNGVQGDSMTVGFVYNIVPVRQHEGLPFSLQLRMTWGLTLVNRDLVVAELIDRFDPGQEISAESVDGTRSGYTIGAGISRDVALGDPWWLRLGADAEFRSARSTYSAVFTFSGDEDSTTPQTAGFRETSLLYVPNAALSLRVPDGPVVSLASRFWFDDNRQLVVRPELNLVFLQYQ